MVLKTNITEMLGIKHPVIKLISKPVPLNQGRS